MYAYDVSILAMTSSLTQAQKVAYREGTTMWTQLEYLQRNGPLKLLLTLMSTPTAQHLAP